MDTDVARTLSYRFIVCFEAHRRDGRVWAVQYREKWYYGREIHCYVPMWSVYRGRTARQPRAYFEGFGQVHEYTGIDPYSRGIIHISKIPVLIKYATDTDPNKETTSCHHASPPPKPSARSSRPSRKRSTRNGRKPGRK